MRRTFNIKNQENQTLSPLARTAAGEFFYGYKYETDTTTGFKVENQFTTFTASSGASSKINEKTAYNVHSIDGSEEPVKIDYMTRADFAGTFPYTTPQNRAAGEALIDDALYIVAVPEGNADAVAPDCDSTDTDWLITDLSANKIERILFSLANL